MDLKKMKIVEESIIRRLNEYAKENLIPAQISEETDSLPETLNIVFDGIGMDSDEALGEVFFYPIEEEASFHGLQVSVILSDDLNEQYMNSLMEAVSLLNCYMPCGAFIVSKATKMLFYKHVAPYSFDMDEDMLYTHCMQELTTAFKLTDRYIEILMKIAEGKTDVAELADLLGI